MRTGVSLGRLAEVLGRYSKNRAALARIEPASRAVAPRAVTGQAALAPKAHALSRRLTPAQQDELVRRYQAGQGCSTLGREFGVSENAVLAQLRWAGVQVRVPGKSPRPI